MKSWNPCKRRDFIRELKALGFKEPYAGANPQLKMLITEISLITAEDINPEYWNNL